MMAPDPIIDVTEASFEYDVIAYSQNTPVLVDFWAAWCQPCKILSPLLERLAREASGSFRLAKVDVDNNPNLALRFGVRSIPTVKAFTQGQVVAEFAGMQPEARLREFISKITPPSPLTLAIEKADSFLAMEQWVDAEKLYRQLLDQNPDNPACLLGLAKVLLVRGQSYESLQILQSFPASRQYNQAELLIPLAEALQAMHSNSIEGESEMDLTFKNTLRLAGRGNLPAALDGLLEILRTNRQYRNGLARLIVLGMLEVMGESNPQTRNYRTELASVLF